MILIFFAIYIAYGTLILIWCILGAVLNPKKFLPMAIGALVFIAFSYRLYSRLTDAHSLILSNATSEVDQELKESLFETMRKHGKKNQVESDASLVVEKQSFLNELNKYLINNSYPLIDKTFIETIYEGNVTHILHILSRNHGVDKNISLGILGMILRDPETILDSI